jgi:hypothetical protein
MRAIIFAIVLASLAVYSSITGVHVGVHAVTYDMPPLPMEPDDDEDEDRVRPPRKK